MIGGVPAAGGRSAAHIMLMVDVVVAGVEVEVVVTGYGDVVLGIIYVEVTALGA